ncbi:MAG: lipase secretion chaperone [Myxococcota bacterium]
MKVRIVFVLSTAVLTLGLLAVLTQGGDRGELSPEELQATSAPASSASPTNDPAGGVAGHNSEFDRALIAHLHARYGEGIEHSTIQMKMLEAMMRHFQVLRPNDWQAALEALVREAFPAHADVILALLRDRLEYQNWIDENGELLGRLDATERESLLREVRQDRFGTALAAELWASEEKSRELAGLLRAVDTDFDGDLHGAVARYRQELMRINGAEIETLPPSQQHQSMTRFLELESVQRELSDMPSGARSENLRRIRAALGLDADALARWEQLDRERDGRWERGSEYMSERSRLSELHEGEALETEIHALRQRTFGDQADVIQREEQRGIFRYDRPRRWGLN